MSGNTGIPSSSIYTSPDGIIWSKIANLNIFPSQIAWSESKKTLCLAGSYYGSYVTEDLINWELIKISSTVVITGDLIWSETANAFISTQGNINQFFRLKI